MTNWEKKIIDAFISHYFASEPDETPCSAITNEDIDTVETVKEESFTRESGTGESRSTLRIRSSLFFSQFDIAIVIFYSTLQ